MRSFQALRHADWRMIPIIAGLMLIGLLTISSMTGQLDDPFWTVFAKSQLRWCCLGWILFFAMAKLDYRVLRNSSWVLYILCLLSLCAVFFVAPIQNVHRWIRIPGLGLTIQPSEEAKIIVSIVLASFLEKRPAHCLVTTLQALCIGFIPFILILKQPDLGTALIIFPIILGICYFANGHAKLIRFLSVIAGTALLLILALFTNILPRDQLRPYCTYVLKEYQYERLNPTSYHQKAAMISIGLGKWKGTGWRQGEFAGKNWLPAAHTDSVFAAYGEEFGLVGLLILLSLFFALIYFSLKVANHARDPFGRLLAIGLTLYLAMHALLNMGMMCALLPISGVPLILVTYGGNSLLTTMAALGILQSIYSRRFMFA